MDPAARRAAESAALLRAVDLAARGAGTVLPNPVVGCVIVDDAGVTVGEGWHERAGGPHAEVVALRAAGARAAGATAVVTLEPCNHTGRTGPCSQALLAAGVRRVVVAVRDPWPTAAGGTEALRAAGVDVRVLGPDDEPHLVDRAEDVNRVWLAATRLRRPFVTFKAGMTADGRVAAPDGTSRWITSVPARTDVHRLRAEVDTMLVGVGTVLADDPQLTARDPDGTVTGRQPLRVVVDSHGRTPPTARVRDGAAETVVATAAEFPGPGGVDLGALLAELYRRGRRHVLLEGGPRLVASMVDGGLVDEVLLYVAPLLLGAGRTVVEGTAVHTLGEAHRLELCTVDRVGADVRLRYRVPAHLGPGAARTDAAGTST
ncbi:bifunctional diaminohydroxyphosphoribosylaminopyrimidine deaminase/5-amino-6-(5-phosphoribosylamino)uracil reductase RibD [Nakamurella endophytica]|uniref:Riboflavin biosynthesis protein RibD n=1 Tax=Nakamurella endophytica TaxID=1748367 RepID=A0A917T129_9ACTN|nr:bifunctional diaminohydroxyphosphoribosylaminopyrimidine deaminase/5-amino-6-(5-phosphoribosylamino)uracil reductase RibD [Nakamurella endophytica]GGM05227.1 riboflavin biosynthesis protein RibD [Nakamurella endophytica]